MSEKNILLGKLYTTFERMQEEGIGRVVLLTDYCTNDDYDVDDRRRFSPERNRYFHPGFLSPQDKKHMRLDQSYQVISLATPDIPREKWYLTLPELTDPIEEPAVEFSTRIARRPISLDDRYDVTNMAYHNDVSLLSLQDKDGLESLAQDLADKGLTSRTFDHIVQQEFKHYRQVLASEPLATKKNRN
jgi:hypothetical protein